MPNQAVLEIQKQIPLVDLINRVEEDPLSPRAASEFELKRAGNIIKAKCPFHEEKTPSFAVYARPDYEDERFHCYGGSCGIHGRHVDYVMSRLNLGFPAALRYIGDKFPQIREFIGKAIGNGYHPANRPEIEFGIDGEEMNLAFELLADAQFFFRQELEYNQGLDARAARVYLDSRNLTSIARDIGVGFAPPNDLLFLQLVKKLSTHKDPFFALRQTGLIGDSEFGIFTNRVTFPIKTLDGRVMGFSGRTLKSRPGESKYKNPPKSLVFDKSHILYGLEHIDQDQVRAHGLYLVEGMTDIYGFFIQSLRCCLAIGSTNLTTHHLGLVDELNPGRVIFVTDGDLPGAIGALKNANKMQGSNHFSKTERPVHILPLPITDKKIDPFDLFYTEGVRVRKYEKAHLQTPEKFFLSILPRIIDAHQKTEVERKALESLLVHDTSNLLTLPQLNHALSTYGIKIKEQKESRYENIHDVPAFLMREILRHPKRPTTRKSCPF